MRTNNFRHDERSNKQRMDSGDWYIAEDPELAAQYKKALLAMRRAEDRYPYDPAGAQEEYKALLGGIGEDVHIRPPARFDYGSNTYIGEGTFVNYGLACLDVARVTIGKNCQIATNVQLLTALHPLEVEPRKARWEAADPITIGDNVWLGGGVIVCPGVTIGDNSVIGAGSVVVKDIPADVIAVGNPCRILRDLPKYEGGPIDTETNTLNTGF
ncbi:sugar O-acetyltransferase [Gleimia hominis]|uniref:sugar O-acetyltransferase n=1 Tax=Gleimia hominis TaxID=595468 RepID=UPI000C80369A|nr:sugar O-acetyltransferase [Gleimia hominis]WIK64182.1 sugar O-acetyltransferase [Gleimia hominis]